MRTATVYFENGTKYMGLLCNRMGLCGDASIQWPSGATYEGQVIITLKYARSAGYCCLFSKNNRTSGRNDRAARSNLRYVIVFFLSSSQVTRGLRHGIGTYTSADG